ncbi:MAG: dTDP-4-amino-4,6-dideoxygalactose transaminase [Flavobacteriales bacterium]|nr:MAG: dTDP-4-amino-4,6-dideoxygalactose transaminase [Flavobacteriales bacterium]
MIPFNKQHLTGKEIQYIEEAVHSGKIAGNGSFTEKCHNFFEKKYGFKKCFLTTSCTDALEMTAILMDLKQGDEVIMPSYTFVSTANAFVLRGAKIVFVDSCPNNPNLDYTLLEGLINSKTKAIVVVHYAGLACDMDAIMSIADKHKLFVVEDAAQAVDSYYKGKPLGGIGHFGTFSFHETKNVSCGEGGMLVVNDEKFCSRAEIIWEKGTNRTAFFRGEIDEYGWVDIGSSFLPSEITAAFLLAQLESLDKIQDVRKRIWTNYYDEFENMEEDLDVRLPFTTNYATNNAQMFYLICSSKEKRLGLISALKKERIASAFHYLPLHKSPFYQKKHDGRNLPNCENFSNCLIRLPLYFSLSIDDQLKIIEVVKSYVK